LKYTASVEEDDITKCTESFSIIERWVMGRECNIGG
jgi:hypothetical protein